VNGGDVIGGTLAIGIAFLPVIHSEPETEPTHTTSSVTYGLLAI
jgi:hypothetical protein